MKQLNVLRYKMNDYLPLPSNIFYIFVYYKKKLLLLGIFRFWTEWWVYWVNNYKWLFGIYIF